jgi:hypothetical protein
MPYDPGELGSAQMNFVQFAGTLTTSYTLFRLRVSNRKYRIDSNILDEAITAQGPSSLVRALKKTRAPLTAFDDDGVYCGKIF